MTNTDENRTEIVSTLDGLIAILEDGKLGYTNAAEHAEEPLIKSNFTNYARERALFIVELQDEINRLGKTTDTAGGGPLGAIHRAWIDIKSTFTSNDTEAIINACITGEEAAVEKYEMALENEHLSPNQVALISKQLNSIRAVLMKLKLNS
ncbi:ferritin-like domain-containing protein [Flavobacterium sp. ARAG 55.4]|uniref:PA2169 family four-helix-bundle protein n=1 Tax=Flavobacterium plantiphilum TaxID=3163297 RepID=A0ABW8XTA6_9FLAO